jgi:hypothetical protein
MAQYMSDMETNDSQKNMSYTASLAERKQSPHPSVS